MIPSYFSPNYRRRFVSLCIVSIRYCILVSGRCIVPGIPMFKPYHLSLSPSLPLPPSPVTFLPYFPSPPTVNTVQASRFLYIYLIFGISSTRMLQSGIDYNPYFFLSFCFKQFLHLFLAGFLSFLPSYLFPLLFHTRCSYPSE